MLIQEVQEVPIRQIGEWSSSSFADPIHPYHGPLPHYCHLVECAGSYFLVYLWDAVSSYKEHSVLIAMVELIWNDSTGPNEPAPELPFRGAIPLTYRWTIDGDGLQCCNHTFQLPSDVEVEIWKAELLATVTEESVRLTVVNPIGEVVVNPDPEVRTASALRRTRRMTRTRSRSI